MDASELGMACRRVMVKYKVMTMNTEKLEQIARRIIEREKELFFSPDVSKAKRVEEIKKLVIKEVELLLDVAKKN
jgi:hypothetical protein